MKVIFNGFEINYAEGDRPSIELLATDETPFGMDAVVTFHSGVYKGKQSYHNLTEIHLFYNQDESYINDVAFESGIHGTGRTHKSAEIESIVITTAESKAEGFLYINQVML